MHERPQQVNHHTLERVDSDEQLLAIIKRHPFGIIKIYAMMILGIGAAGSLVYYLLPNFFVREENPEIYSAIAIIAGVVIALLVVILVVATIVYTQSKLVVTDKTITQTLQIGLFNRKVSQLAVSNIEDVTANKNGFFPTILNFGKLFVETAGEQENFHFEYCPDADHYAKLILETRQQFMTKHELEMREESRAYVAYQQQAPQQPQPAPTQPAPPTPGTDSPGPA